MNIEMDFEFLRRLVLLLFSMVGLVLGVYYGFNRKRAYASAFLLFGLGVFLITALLHSSDISMGFAFGLFAVFSMLRYRTESISVKEMTYLFLVISIALLCAVADLQLVYIGGINILLISICYVLEKDWILPKINERIVEYEKIENVHLERLEELKEDIRTRTGWDVQTVDIMAVDFVKDSAQIKVGFKSHSPYVEDLVSTTGQS